MSKNKAAENEGALNISDSALGKYLARMDRKLDRILGLLDSDDRAAAIEDSIDSLPEFPLNAVKAFVKFTKKSTEDRKLRRIFQSKVRKIGGKSGEAHLTNALVMTMTNSLGTKLTWDGQRATRGIKDTTFANIIIGTVASQNTTTSQSALTHTFSEWLRRAGDRYRYHLKSGRET